MDHKCAMRDYTEIYKNTKYNLLQTVYTMCVLLKYLVMSGAYKDVKIAEL